MCWAFLFRQLLRVVKAGDYRRDCGGSGIWGHMREDHCAAYDQRFCEIKKSEA